MKNKKIGSKRKERQENGKLVEYQIASVEVREDGLVVIIERGKEVEE